MDEKSIDYILLHYCKARILWQLWLSLFRIGHGERDSVGMAVLLVNSEGRFEELILRAYFGLAKKVKRK